MRERGPCCNVCALKIPCLPSLPRKVCADNISRGPQNIVKEDRYPQPLGAIARFTRRIPTKNQLLVGKNKPTSFFTFQIQGFETKRRRSGRKYCRSNLRWYGWTGWLRSQVKIYFRCLTEMEITKLAVGHRDWMRLNQKVFSVWKGRLFRMKKASTGSSSSNKNRSDIMRTFYDQLGHWSSSATKQLITEGLGGRKCTERSTTSWKGAMVATKVAKSSL